MRSIFVDAHLALAAQMQNDNWQYFKDKPWLLAIGNNTVLVNFTTDKFTGLYNLVVYKSTDNGSS